jgi:CMP-N,N'-diacetyllegionaminic acid synthase
MAEYTSEIWGIIPARGGSKSIPLKNLAKLSNRPLIEYVIRAAQACSSVDRIVCSTEDERIRGFCLEQGIEVHNRPKGLAADDTNVLDVLVDLLIEFRAKEVPLPAHIVLLQPTSPFVLPSHIDTCVNLIENDNTVNSSQTVTKFPHNFHAYNQRVIEKGYVRFMFAEERKRHYNKQTKPEFYIFGNLVVVRSKALLQGKEIFAEPSIPHIVPYQYALDVDGPVDLELAEWYLSNGKVVLSHL